MKRKSEFVVVITTTDKIEEAQKLVNTILVERLAACAQIFEIESHYWWKECLEKANEYRIEFKTREALIEKLIKKIKELHSYEVPEVIVLPMIGGEDSYFNWIKEETTKK